MTGSKTIRPLSYGVYTLHAIGSQGLMVKFLKFELNSVELSSFFLPYSLFAARTEYVSPSYLCNPVKDSRFAYKL